MTFDWRDYVTLDSGLGDYADEVALAFDRLAQTPEGRELIEKAHRLTTAYGAPGKLRISPPVAIGDPMTDPVDIHDLIIQGTTAPNQLRGRLHLNFDTIARAMYQPPASSEAVPSGLMDTLIHELHHLANPKVYDGLRDFMHAVMQHAINAPGRDDGEKQAIFDAAFQEIVRRSYHPSPPHSDNQAMAKHLLSVLSTDTELKKRIAVRLGLDPQSFAFRDLTPLTLDNLQDTYLPLNPLGWHDHEEEAVLYRDDFMAKYFDAPARRTFHNGWIGLESFAISVPEFKCGATIPQLYQWEEVRTGQGTFTPPTIHPTSCEQVLAAIGTNTR